MSPLYVIAVIVSIALAPIAAIGLVSLVIHTHVGIAMVKEKRDARK